ISHRRPPPSQGPPTRTGTHVGARGQVGGRSADRRYEGRRWTGEGAMSEQPITIVSEDIVSVWYHPGPKIVHHQFRSFVFGEQFRNILERGLEAFQRYGACKWLSDDRGNSAIGAADTEWAINSWAPRVISAGWRYWAVV